MKNNDIYKLIEAYLDDSLPEANLRGVEQRIAEDKAFRQEVNLHRELRTHFADPHRWYLHQVLSEVMEEPLSPEGSPPEEPPPGPADDGRSRPVWVWIFFLVLLLGAGVWYFNSPSKRDTHHDNTEQQQEENMAVPGIEEDAIPEIEQHLEAPASSKQQELKSTGKPSPDSPPVEKIHSIAQADPADFAPNHSMDLLVSSGTRSIGGYTFIINAPANDTDFSPNRNGDTKVRFAGSVERESSDADIQFKIIILSTKDIRTRILSIPVALAKGDRNFELQQSVDFERGLYYFMLMVEGESNVAYTGRFTIGKK